MFMMMMLALTQPATAGWVQWEGQTQEGQTLVVEKKGRATYRVRLEGGDKGDGIKCSGFFNMLRTPLAMNIRTAGERAASNTQLGSVVSYQESLTAMTNAGNASLMPGLCVLGVDALSGAAVLTLGSTLKMNGRSATLTPDQASELGTWLGQ